MTFSFPLRVTEKGPLWDPLVLLSLKEPLKWRLPVAPLAVPLAPVILATPLKVTVTGPLSPLEHPVELDLVAISVILLAAPVMLPVPLNGSHCAVAEAEPVPATELAPTSEGVPVPVPVTEEIITSLLLMSSETVPE